MVRIIICRILKIIVIKVLRKLILGASFAEYFYGLTRINNKTNQFGKTDYYRSILSLVFFPYAYEKLKTYVDKLDGKDTSERLKYVGFLNVYKIMRTIFETAKLVQILGK